MSADRSCQNIVNQTAIDRMIGGLAPVSTRTGCYCRARQRLPKSMVMGLTEHVGELIESETSSEWLWQGRRVTDFRKGKRLGQRDHLIALAKPKIKPGWMSQSSFEVAPVSITVREFRAGGKTMVTTMTCPKTAPKSKLKALYKTHWNVELDLRSIKDTLGMNILSCKSPDMAEKEIWVYLLAYNLIRWMMVQSALLVDINPRCLSFKHSLQL